MMQTEHSHNHNTHSSNTQLKRDTSLGIASRKRRLLALMIDHSLIGYLMVMVGLLTFQHHWDLASTELLLAKSQLVGLLSVLFFIFKDSVNGASPGKFLMGIAVRKYRQPQMTPSLFALALRNTTLCIWPIEGLVMVFNSSKRRMGDWLGHTQVMRIASQSGKRLLLAIFCVVFVWQVGHYTQISLLGSSQAWQQVSVQVHNQTELVQWTGEIDHIELLEVSDFQLHDGAGRAKLTVLVVGERQQQVVILSLEKAPTQTWQVTQLKFDYNSI